MPLQIRRGTKAELNLIPTPLAEGELVYVTDEEKLYIGNGTTEGGLAVTGFTAEEAQDAAAALFSSGTHDVITFTYNDVDNKIDTTVDLSDYAGNIGFNEIDVSAVPSANNTYNLGSVAKKWNNAYLGGALQLGDAVVTHTGSVVNLPAGTTIGGQTLEQALESIGGNINANIVGNDSSVIVDAETNTVTARFVGDLTGSIFADDSGLLVDAIDRVFYGSFDTGSVLINGSTVSGAALSLGDNLVPMNVSMKLNNDLELRSLANPTLGKYIALDLSRGTIDSPAAVQAGDELGGVVIRAYSNSSTSAIAGIFGFTVDPTAVIAGGNFVKSLAIISAASDTTQELADSLVLNSAGEVTSNAFIASKFMQLPVYADDTARSAAIPTPAAGMMVFMTSGTVPTVTNKPVIYNGTTWEAF